MGLWLLDSDLRSCGPIGFGPTMRVANHGSSAGRTANMWQKKNRSWFWQREVYPEPYKPLESMSHSPSTCLKVPLPNNAPSQHFLMMYSGDQAFNTWTFGNTHPKFSNSSFLKFSFADFSLCLYVTRAILNSKLIARDWLLLSLCLMQSCGIDELCSLSTSPRTPSHL